MNQPIQRPTSLTVISIILLVSSGLSLLLTPINLMNEAAIEIMEMSPLPVSVQIGLSVVGGLVTLGCAIGFLKGISISRKIYLGWSLVGFLIGFLTSPMKWALIPGLVFLGVILYFLFRRNATAYFNQQSSADA